MNRAGHVLLWVCMAGFLVRLSYVLTLPPEIFWFDGEQYSLLATNLVQHGTYSRVGLQPSAFWPPGYPFFLAGVYAAFGLDVTAVRLVQCVLGSLSIALVYGIARRVLDAAGSWLAVAAMTFYPLYVYSAGAMFPVTLQVTLLAGALLLARVARERHSVPAVAGAGLLGGWATLTAGTALPAMLLVAPWLACRPAGEAARSRWLLAVVYLLALALPLAGWGARNQAAFGKPVLVSTNFGYNLWLGNFPGVDPTTGARYPDPAMDREANRIWESPGTEVTRDRQFLDLALRHIGADLPRFASLSLGKASEFWSFYTEPATERRPKSGWERLASLLSYGLLLPFALVWLVRSLRKDPFAWLVLGIFVVYTLAHAVVLSKMRYRLPLDALVIVYGAGGVVALARAAWARFRGAAPGVAMLLGMVLLVPSADSAPRPELRVFAAASLGESFRDLAARFERAHPGTVVRLHLAGSQQLLAQIEAGAQAEVLATADERSMEQARARGLLAGAPAVFARNRVVVIVPRKGSTRIDALPDLARPGWKLVLAAANVPIGRYSREALARLDGTDGFPADYSERVLANLVSEEDNVKGVAGKVALGEADAGLVYASDVTPALARSLRRLELPPAGQVVARYPIAPLAAGSNPSAAAAFVALVRSRIGAQVLSAHGFQPGSGDVR